MMLRRLINSVRPTSTELAAEVPTTTLLGWYWRKAGGPALRGLSLAAFFRKAQLPVFIGSRVTILYKKQISLSRGVSIGAGSVIVGYARDGIHLGQGVTIREGAWIQCSSHPANPGAGLTVDAGTYVGPNAVIGVGGPVSIGASCQIGANFVVVAENHALLEDGTPSPTEVTRKGVSIGDNCWLGHGVTVLDGVVLGANTTVGAGAVVTKSFPANSRIAGVPARPLA